MARTAREKSKTGIYHVMLRGINRQTIFEDLEDYEMFLSAIGTLKEKGGFNLYAFCLMSNHIHMLIHELDESVSMLMKSICARYVLRYNKKYERCGHLFQERFKSETVENESYLLTVLRYIHQNPVKAGIVKNVEDYKWSSYNEYIGGYVSKLTDSGFALDIFSPKRENAIHLFKEYHNEIGNDTCLDYEDFINHTDSEIIKMAADLGIKCSSMMQCRDRNDRDNKLRKLMGIEGVTIRQISRITGISRSVIGRVGTQDNAKTY